LTTSRTLESLYINPILDVLNRQNPSTSPFLPSKDAQWGFLYGWWADTLFVRGSEDGWAEDLAVCVEGIGATVSLTFFLFISQVSKGIPSITGDGHILPEA